MNSKVIYLIALLSFFSSFSVAQNCRTCNGRGYLEQSTLCNRCEYGYIKSTTTRDCSRCYGAGTIESSCSKCSGRRFQYASKEERCPVCKGSGYAKVKENAGQCRTCAGTGNTKMQIGSWEPGTRCPDCNGEGVKYVIRETYCRNCSNGMVAKREQVPCSQCNGTGTEKKTCPQCQGRKRTTEQTTSRCSVCNGTGSKTVRNKCSSCNGSGKMF